MATVAEQMAAARQAMQAGRRDEAWRMLAPIARQFPDEPAIQLEAGRAALMAGQAAGAVQLLATATRLKPELAPAWGMLGEAYGAAGQARDGADALEQAIARGTMPFAVHARAAGLRLLADGWEAARPAFDRALGLMLADLEAGRFDAALAGEELLFEHVVRQVESEDHLERCLARWRPAMTAAGERAARGLPPPKTAFIVGAPVVGFFLHAASVLGHVEVALDYMTAMAADATAPIRPHLYVFAGVSDALQEDCRRRGIPVTFVEREEAAVGRGYEPYRRLLWLRERAARDGAVAMVWLTMQSLSHFAAAFRIAPLNVFWAMRFRGIDSPYIEGRVACASCFERGDVVNGRRWELVPLAFRDLRGPERAVEAAALRRQLGDPPLLLGTFARREKMQDDCWLDAVGRSLKACPEALFLWAGREKDAKVARAFADMGVEAQTRFVGWVDTRLYNQAIDIFLDTAPVGCGLTAMQAMAWGKPLVSFKDPLTNWGQCLGPVLSGQVKDAVAEADIRRIFALDGPRALLAWADDAGAYADWVRRLASDATLRSAVGAAGRAFTDKYFGDPAYAAGRMGALLRAWLAGETPQPDEPGLLSRLRGWLGGKA